MSFLDPDPQIQLLREDLAWPLALDSGGDLASVIGLDCLEADVVGRAATTRGEIIHRPEYGLEDDESQNGPIVDEDMGLLEARLLEQYTRDPRIDSLTVVVQPDPNVDGDVVANIRVMAKSGEPVGVSIPMGGS